MCRGTLVFAFTTLLYVILTVEGSTEEESHHEATAKAKHVKHDSAAVHPHQPITYYYGIKNDPSMYYRQFDKYDPPYMPYRAYDTNEHFMERTLYPPPIHDHRRQYDYSDGNKYNPPPFVYRSHHDDHESKVARRPDNEEHEVEHKKCKEVNCGEAAEHRRSYPPFLSRRYIINGK